jgi:hypothetical protein
LLIEYSLGALRALKENLGTGRSVHEGKVWGVVWRDLEVCSQWAETVASWQVPLMA